MANLWIVMDGIEYQLPITQLERSFEFLDGGQGGVMQSGLEVLDTIGTRYGYSVTLPRIGRQQSEYDAFFEAVTSPERIHTITLPYGQRVISFDCKIESGSDRLGSPAGDMRTWGDLSLSFTPIRPQRMAEDDI